MAERFDGYQVFQVLTEGKKLFPVAPCRGSFREAVEDKLRIRANDKFGIYEIHGIINKNNNK